MNYFRMGKILVNRRRKSVASLGRVGTLDKLAADAGHDEGRPVQTDPDRRAISPRSISRRRPAYAWLDRKTFSKCLAHGRAMSHSWPRDARHGGRGPS
jgi:hypothetical protein